MQCKKITLRCWGKATEGAKKRQEKTNKNNKGLRKADVQDVSRRTVSRFLNLSGYNYLQARKKGRFSNDDNKSTQSLQKMYGPGQERYMDKKSGFLLGGVGFVYKRNPKDQALAPDGRVWRA